MSQTAQDTALIENRRKHDATYGKAQAIILDLLKADLARPTSPRQFYDATHAALRKSVEAAVERSGGNWAQLMQEIEKILAAAGVTNAAEAARRACAVAEKGGR